MDMSLINVEIVCAIALWPLSTGTIYYLLNLIALTNGNKALAAPMPFSP
jgi:hypothetical protein